MERFKTSERLGYFGADEHLASLTFCYVISICLHNLRSINLLKLLILSGV